MYSEVLFSHDLRYVQICIYYICGHPCFQVLHVFGVWGILKKKAFPKCLQDEPYQVPCNIAFPF